MTWNFNFLYFDFSRRRTITMKVCHPSVDDEDDDLDDGDDGNAVSAEQIKKFRTRQAR